MNQQTKTAGKIVSGTLLATSLLFASATKASGISHLGTGAEVRSTLVKNMDGKCGSNHSDSTSATKTKMKGKSKDGKCGEGKCGGSKKKSS